ncbi:sigma factor [Streptomyces sp. CRN 30]|uniref:sigma factor n=1 Tax=Streptomyces sp. CRN 30 TaxID=3075613 RepID=UPI002A7F09B8|nr:sigma factor [Streptomyces sp. CRN 30]
MATAGTDADGTAGERRQLVNVAYRLLGSLAESEDAVQEAYARWYALPRNRRDEIVSPGAWLTTVTGRICLDVLGSARTRRERYVGAWLPDPLPERAEREQGHGSDPAERVAFVLHDVFRYPFAVIADVLGRTPAACKQLAASARRRVHVAGTPATAAGQADTVRRVKEAWQTKDIAALVGLLDPAAVMTADGGGVVGTVLRPIEGGARIAQYMVAIADRAPGLDLVERSVNGVPGLVARRAGTVLTVASFEVTDGRVTRIWVVRNPEKLRRGGGTDRS